jgi:hypothetical protein
METDTFTFTFNTNGSPLETGPNPITGLGWPLGEVLATVPNVANQHIYQATQLLPVTNVTSDGTLSEVGGAGFQLVACLGDGSGDGALTTADAAQANAIVGAVINYNSVSYATVGFVAFPNVDPVVIADTDAAEVVDGGAGAGLALIGAGFSVATIPTPPHGANVLIGPAVPNGTKLQRRCDLTCVGIGFCRVHGF